LWFSSSRARGGRSAPHASVPGLSK
jgi:hypothetical protein